MQVICKHSAFNTQVNCNNFPISPALPDPATNFHRTITQLLVGLAAGCGCVGASLEARHSDGLLDFLGALAGSPRRDVVPGERMPGRAGEIVTAHAEAAGAGVTRVFGTARTGFGFGEIYEAHIDVKVIGRENRLLATLATDHFPRPIPSDYRGQPRRATFSARLPFVPVTGSTVQVAFHQMRRSNCGFDYPTFPSKA